MINHLNGTLVEKSAPFLVLDVNGVGYELQASLTAFAGLPALGEMTKLLTHFIVREDAHLLFGFADEAERTLFRTLIKVNGVGPKLALAILSGMDVAAFSRCVLGSDIKALTQLPGVGKKTAERLVIEMKDRLKEWQIAGNQSDAVGQSSAAVSSASAVLIDEAETALVALGYKPVEASKAIARLKIAEFANTESLVRAALQAMLKR